MRNMEVVKSMEFVLDLLHKEWERSGETKKEFIMDMAQMDKVMKDFAQLTEDTQNRLEKENLSFCQSIVLSHEIYILLRTMRKILTAMRRLEKSGGIFARILLDKEETRLYLKLVQEE